MPASPQSLPQIADRGSPRPLLSADAARGWEAIGRLDTGTSFCSATLIAPDLVLTAAHCLYDTEDMRIDDGDLVFSAGLRNGRADAVRRVTASYVPQDYVSLGRQPEFDQVQRDIALLELDRPILSGVVVPIGTGPRGRPRDVVSVVSYGRDRETHASIQEDCRIVARQDAVTALTCSVVSGSSGAPILRETLEGVEVVAVVSAVGAWEGADAAFAVDVDAVLPDLLNARSPAPGRIMSGGVVRRLSAGDDGRGTVGARFLRP